MRILGSFVVAVATLLLALCGAEAQAPGKIPRIGYASGTGVSSSPGPQVEAFRQGLRDLGYVEGKNIQVEYRYSQLTANMPDLVTELVRLKVDVLVLPTLQGLSTAKNVTKSMPIVMVSPIDPVAAAFVDSLAHPGGNITGVVRLTRELSRKRLELFKEAVPKVSRAGILWDKNAPGPVLAFKEYEAAARDLKLEFHSLGLQRADRDVEDALQAASKARVNALVVTRSRGLDRHLKRIVDFAVKNRLPSLWEGREFVEDGGLMSYTADEAESFKRAAWYVDKILKGAKPADLPVEQPTKFELVINLKTAKQIGVTIPQSMLYRADKVIK